MVTVNATSARSNLFQILKKTAQGHVPTKISSKEGNVVMISEEDYESLLETAELLSISGMKESIKKADKEIVAGKTVKFEELFKDEIQN